MGLAEEINIQQKTPVEFPFPVHRHVLQPSAISPAGGNVFIL